MPLSVPTLIPTASKIAEEETPAYQEVRHIFNGRGWSPIENINTVQVGAARHPNGDPVTLCFTKSDSKYEFYVFANEQNQLWCPITMYRVDQEGHRLRIAQIYEVSALQDILNIS
jgi:hypothetical protein